MLLRMRSARERKWKLEFKGQIEDFDPRSSLAYWKGKSADEKFAEVDTLIRQALLMKGQTDFDGHKLLRFTAVLKRG